MIDIDNITVRFRSAESDVTSLDSVSLHVGKGEYVAILGPNGSGKSTLVRAMCGMVEHVEGNVKLLGRDVRTGKFGEDFFGDVGVVFQEPEGQFLMPTVKREIESVLQNLGLPLEKQKERFEEIVSLFQLGDILTNKPENLSGGQMQIVNLACALATQPQILILDEPTTFLDLHYRNVLISYLEKFHKEGVTIVNVTQFPDEAIKSDRVIILDKGSCIFEGSVTDAFKDSDFLIEHRLTVPKKQISEESSSQLDEFHYRTLRAKKRNLSVPQLDFELKKKHDKPIIRVEKIKYSYPKSDFILEIDKLELFKNEIVGFVGSTGSGKSTLAYLLAGLYEPDEGQVYHQGKLLSEYTIGELRRSVGITWQLPDLAMLGPTVKEDIEFGITNLGMENVQFDQLLKQVGLEGFENRIVDTLSGGEKRKLAIAGILATMPSYIILDEPAAFLDPVSQQELIEIILKIAEDGKGILVIGHDVVFLSEIADRIIGIKAGKLQFDIPAREFFSNLKFFDLL